MTAINLLWGPATAGDFTLSTSALSSQALNDNNNAIALVVQLPRSGTVDRVGFYVHSKTGTPPAYKIGITTLDSSGRPTQTAYGGSAIEDYTPDTTGWVWVTLATPATAVLGEFCAIHIFPGASAPDAGNCINVTIGKPIAGMYGSDVYYTTAWLEHGGLIPMALAYDDDSIHGLALAANTTVAGVLKSTTTPDEAGAKFTLPFGATIYGARFFSPYIYYGTACAFEVVLYDAASNVLATTTVSDKDLVDMSFDGVNVFFTAVELAASTVYRIAVKPTVGTNGDIYVGRLSFDSAAAKAAIPLGSSFDYTARTDAGAWTDTTNDLPYMALWLNAIDLAAAPAASNYQYCSIG